MSRVALPLLLLLGLILSLHGRAQQTFFPAAIPLSVRSPYLNCWYYPTNGSVFGKQWPGLYNPSTQILGWAVFVRVDDATYSFLGSSPEANLTVTVTNTMVTPTQTKVTAKAGAMEFNLTFLNPIEPGDWVKQSIPFSYVSLTAKSLDGAAHTVQVYSDVSGEWNSGDRTHIIHWNTMTTSSTIYHYVTLQTPALFSEKSNQAEWGTLYYAMELGNTVSYTIAAGATSRTNFRVNGALDNQVADTTFRSIQTDFPIFAISRDLGPIQATQAPIVWAVGYTIDPAISYSDLSGDPPKQRRAYYKTQYADDGPLITDFLNDFTNASSRAQQLDQNILRDAASIFDLYGDLVSISIAQVYGSTQLTIGTDENRSDVMMFMKNIGGSTPNRANAVETLYAAFPAFMYLDPSLGAPLLEPLFRLQQSPKYTLPYAATDLGSSYPNVTGSNAAHDQGVEQSGNMLIMTYAYGRASGDGNIIAKYYPLLTSWADYLSSTTLFIHNQTSADGLSVNNQTNLAIKGIIAIKAMGDMSAIVRRPGDAAKYYNAAASLYGQWKSLALDSVDRHMLAAYGQASWTLGYNLFADRWLGTNLVEQSVYENHSSTLDKLVHSNFNEFGLPVDSLGSDESSVVSSWNLFAQAMTSNSDLSGNLITGVHNKASLNTSANVFPLIYNTSHGSTVSGVASPAQGAMFAPLALKAVRPITFNTTVATSTKNVSHAGVIAGATVATLGALFSVIGVVTFVRRRQRRKIRNSIGAASSSTSLTGMAPQMAVTPFYMAPHETIQRDPESWMTRSQSQSSVSLGAHDDAGGSGSSSAPVPLPLFDPPMVPPHAGLSSKELARLRSEALARSSNHSHSESSGSQSVTPPPRQRSMADARILRSEVENLRREVDLLREERLEAPPSYASQVGDT